MNEMQAFSATQHFYDKYFWMTKSDEIAVISSSISLLIDGNTADPSCKKEWLDCTKIIIPEYCDGQAITKSQAFAITKEFLELYNRIGFSEEVQELIDRMRLDSEGEIIDPEIKAIWYESLDLAVEKGSMYLELTSDG